MTQLPLARQASRLLLLLEIFSPSTLLYHFSDAIDAYGCNSVIK